MSSPPVAAAVVTLGAGAMWSTVFLISGPAGARWLLGVGGWSITLVTLAGLLVARSRWSVRMAIVTAALAIPGVALSDRLPITVVGAVLSMAAVGLAVEALASGRVRPFRAADAPPDDAVVLMLLGVVAPFVLGVAALGGGPRPVTVVAAVVAPVVAWWFGRISVPALWAQRLLVPSLVVAAGRAEGVPWGAVALVLGGAIGWFAWRPSVRLAADPLDPVSVVGKPVFAEFAPREVRAAAGVDERGRR